jgi:acyl carrier protein
VEGPVTEQGLQPESTLLDQVRALIRALDGGGDAAPLTDEQSLLDAGVIDSLAMIDLIASLESRFALRLQDADLTPENFDSVISIRDMIQRKLDAAR